MEREFPESDWKTLRDSARSRWGGTANESSKRSQGFPPIRDGAITSATSSYSAGLASATTISRRPSTSRAARRCWQLAAIYVHGLLEPDEFARFTLQTRERIQLIAKEAR